MIRKFEILFCCILCFSIRIFAQSDSTKFEQQAGISDGIYLSYSDFRFHRAISKNQVNSNADTSQIDFFSKLLAKEKISFKNGTVSSTMETNKIWGYFQNNALYLNYNNEFHRVPIFGAISFFVASVKVSTPTYYDQRFGMANSTTYVSVLKELIMSLYDGSVREATIEEAEALFKSDNNYYETVKKINYRKRKKQITLLIRNFNALHPVYFLK